MISEIAMLMFLSYNRSERGVKEIIALSQAVAPSSIVIIRRRFAGASNTMACEMKRAVEDEGATA